MKKSMILWGIFMFALMNSLKYIAYNYSQMRMEFTTLVNLERDCKYMSIVDKYPTVCAKIIKNPPSDYFITYIIKDCIDNISICGPRGCFEFLSISNFLMFYFNNYTFF